MLYPGFILLYRCYGNKNGERNRLKIEKLIVWAKLKAFEDLNLKIKYMYKHKQIP